MGGKLDDKYYGSFHSIESNLKKYPIIGFDTEDDSKGTVLLYAFYSDERKLVTRHWKEAHEFIYSIPTPTIFVAHNLEYDIANLFKHDDYLMVENMLYSSLLLKVTLYGTKHFFINSLCFFKGPLKKMAEFVGLEKLEGNALDEKYVLRDAEIPYRFMTQFQEKLHNEMGVNLGVTLGQMAMATYRRNYMIEKKQITFNHPKILRAYYGGRTEIFYKGEVKNVKVVDINSCYPYVMREYSYPDTSYIEHSSIYTHQFGIGKFKIYVPSDLFIPVLPYKKGGSGKLFFPVGDIIGWWTYQEVRYAVSLGCKILVEYEGLGTERGCTPFVEFVTDYYEKRIGSKKKLKMDSNNVRAKFESLLYKLWINNLYGKWAQWRPTARLTRDKFSESRLKKLRENPDFKENKIGPFYSYTIPKEKPALTANYFWGVYITSYARIYLHKGIMQLHRAGATLLYCDTDSVMYMGLEKCPLKLSQELGDWDNEKYDLGIFRQAKGYLLCDRKKGNNYEIKKAACKGVPTDYAYDFIIKGMATVMKPLKLKEALIRSYAEVNKNEKEFLKDIGVNIWREVPKEMKSIYVKRKGIKGVTFPISVTEISKLEKDGKNEKESIEKYLRKNNIRIKKPIYKNNFENTRVPNGYFNGYRNSKIKPQVQISNKIFSLRIAQCVELKSNKTWFTGDILRIVKGKWGKQYEIFIKSFKGKIIPFSLLGRINTSFFENFGVDENLKGKFVDIKMGKNYSLNGSLSFRFNFSESKFVGQFEDEEIKDDELTETELKTLMAYDWSKISCLKKKT